MKKPAMCDSDGFTAGERADAVESFNRVRMKLPSREDVERMKDAARAQQVVVISVGRNDILFDGERWTADGWKLGPNGERIEHHYEGEELQ